MIYNNFKITLFLLLLVNFGCSHFRKPEPPEIKVKEVVFSGINQESFQIDFRVDAKNTNNFDIEIDEVEYQASINETQLPIKRISSIPKLLALKTTTVNVPVELKYSDVFNSILSIFANKKIKTSIKGKVKTGFYSIPFESENEIKM